MNGTNVRPVACTRPTGKRAAMSAILGSLLASTCSCSWLAAFMARPACSLPKRAALALPRLSRPNSTSGVTGVEWLAFAVMIGTPWNQQGTGLGVPGFHGLRLVRSERWAEPIEHATTRAAQSAEVHNYIT